MTKVLLTGARTGLGRRVVTRLEALGVEVVRADVIRADGLTVPVGTDTVVHLAAGDHDTLAARGASALEGTPELLDQASAAGVRHLVVLSSAMVYGAWPNNPVPLTEDAALRPDAAFAFAQQLAQVEQRADDWRLAAPGRRVGVLRPVIAMAADGTSDVVRALAAGMGHRFGEEDAPAQFLHLDDLADAVAVAVDKGLDGAYNVAPDGWIAGDRVRALSGVGPRLRLPTRLADAVANWQWRFQRGPIAPELWPYVRYPWLVANDRLRREGWRPTVTNEQAYVEGTEAKWWTMLTPQRKQELALGGMVAASVGVLGVVLSMIRRGRRKRRADPMRAARRG